MNTDCGPANVGLPTYILNPTPASVVLKPGESSSITIQAPWAYPLGIDFASSNSAVAVVTGRIAPGFSAGTVQIAARSEGCAVILCTIYNFAKAPGFGTVGRIVVTTREQRRRAVAH